MVHEVGCRGEAQSKRLGETRTLMPPINQSTNQPTAFTITPSAVCVIGRATTQAVSPSLPSRLEVTSSMGREAQRHVAASKS